MRLLWCLLLLATSLYRAEAEQSGCPETEAGQRVAEVAELSRIDGETPYLFRKQDRTACPRGDDKSCASPLSWYWNNFCSFEQSTGGGWAAYMICDEARQQSIVKYLRERGVAGFEGILNFSPCDLWPLIRGRTLWIVGDSHSYDLFHALACFLVQLYDHDYSQEFPYAREAEAFAHLEQHVEHYKPPECLPLLEGTMLCQIRVNRGQMVREHTLPLLQRMARPTDIAVVNFAHWHNGWEGHEYSDLLHAFRDHVTAHADELPHIVWKQMVPTHYKHLHGAYKGGTPPFECAPLGVQLQPDGSLAPTDELSQLMLEGGAHNKAAMEAFAGTDIMMTHSWNATAELYEYHRELDGRGHECGHYCFPGVPEMWIYYVYEAIRDASWKDF